ncbi:MAG: serine protein kinase RIO [Actinopolymorphaceae bacterium]
MRKRNLDLDSSQLDNSLTDLTDLTDPADVTEDGDDNGPALASALWDDTDDPADDDVFSQYDDDAPRSSRMRRRRSEAEPAPRARGRMTEEARARLTQEREAAAIADGPPTGYRWTTWDDHGAPRGPEPYPDWLVTDLAAVDTEFGILKTGKEADVYLIERATLRQENDEDVPDADHACLLASKRYRSAEHRLFHRDSGYLEGRRARKSREARALSNRTNFGRNLIAQQWAVTEFAALGELWSAGAPVPYPVQHIGTELLMEFVGTNDGEAAPRLAQLRPEPAELADLWKQLLDALMVLARLGYTHGDLSAYNLLVHEGTLVLIDLPQLVDVVTNPQGVRFLERDAQTICTWFVSRGLAPDVADPGYVVALVLGEAGVT